MPARRHSLPHCILAALATLFAAPAAFAEEAQAPFGNRGQVALDKIFEVSSSGGSSAPPAIYLPYGLGSIGYGYRGIAGYMHDSTNTNTTGGQKSSADMVWLAPSVDVFVHDRVSIGGTLAVSLARGTSTIPGVLGQEPQTVTGTGFGFTVMPRVGYAIPLGSTFALWPRVGFGYGASSASYDDSLMDARPPWTDRWMGEAELGLVARLHRHVYVNLAPRLALTVNRTGSESGSRWDRTYVELGAAAGFGILLGS
jgi:hypothetical protein